MHRLDLDTTASTTTLSPKPASAGKKKVGTADQSPASQKRRSRTKKIGIGIGGLVVVVGAVGSGWWLMTQSHSSVSLRSMTASPTPSPTPTVPDSPNPLNGVLFTKEEAASWNERRPVAVMVENHIDARPQSGLEEAEVLYEAMAEGGITRFMAVYLHNQPAKIGPVRSARLHFISWAAEYQAAYAHWGGSTEALAYLQQNGVPKNIDQFYNAAAFYRDYSGGKSLEHTGYTSIEALRQVSSKQGWESLPTFKSWPFKSDAASETRPATQVINLAMLGNAAYAARFEYQPESNTYLRWTGGKPHLSAEGQQLAAKTIVLQFQTAVNYTDSNGHPAVTVTTVGSGPAVVIEDGKAINGKWSKTSNAVRTVFSDANGEEISLNRGLVWVVSVPQGSGYTIE